MTCRTKLIFLPLLSSEPEFDPRFGNREWQAGKSGTGPDIEDPMAGKHGPYRQAIEDMARNHGLRIPNSGQIDALIPARQLSQEPGELIDALRRQILAQRYYATCYQLTDFFDGRACLWSGRIQRGKFSTYATINAMKSSTAVAASLSRFAQSSSSSFHCPCCSLGETLDTNFCCNTGMPSSRRCR